MPDETSIPRRAILRLTRSLQIARNRIRAPIAGLRVCFLTAGAKSSGKRVVVFESDWLGTYPFLRPLARRCALSGRVLPIIVTNPSEIPAFSKEIAEDSSLQRGRC